MTRVAVVGGGAVGVTAAAELARRGCDVTLFERGDLAAGSTGRAAGIWYEAVAGRLDAAVARAALTRFRDLEGATRLTLTELPYVWLARDGDERRVEAISTQLPRMQARGQDVEEIDPSRLGDRFPALRTDDVAIAAIAHDAGYLDPSAYTAVVTAQARAAGAAFETQTSVSLQAGPTVETPTGTRDFDAALVAAGAHTRPLLADAGYAIPVKAYRVQALVTEEGPAAQGLPICYDATAGVYCRPDGGGILVGDGTEPRDFDPDDWNREADESFLTAAQQALDDLLAPTASRPTERRRSWAGLCTATPDRDPLLGELSDGLFVAVGWHGHGLMRAPAVGTAIAQGICSQLAEESISEPWVRDVLDAFDPGRFDGDEDFAVVEGMAFD